MTDYYEILGVIPNAEAVVIKAAYRALVSIYHPDKNSDPTAEEKTRSINEAYSVLSDSIKKNEYDRSRVSAEHSANSTSFEQEQPFTQDPLEKNWSIAVDIYPRLTREFEALGRISWRLAFAVKLQLLESREFEASSLVAARIKKEYLHRYFGDNEAIVEYAEMLIKHREIKAALHLNEIVNVMGESINSSQAKSTIGKKFPGIDKRVRGAILYEKLLDSRGYYYDKSAAFEIVILHRGIAQRSFLGDKIKLTIDGNVLDFRDSEEFRQYLLTHFSELYGNEKTNK